MRRRSAWVWLGLAAAALAPRAGAELSLGPRSELVHPGAGHDFHLSGPAVAAGPGGAVWLAWARQDAAGRSILVARAAEPGAEPVRVDPPELSVDAIHQAPGLAAGPGGELYVSWSSQKPRPAGVLFASDLQLSRSLDGGRRFEAPLRVNEDRPISHSFEGLAAAADGSVLVAWIDSRDGWEQAATFAARIAERGTRNAGTVRIDGDTCVCCRVALAAGPGSSFAALWRKDFPASVRDMVLARSLDGGRSFGAPALVHRDAWAMPACPHRGGAIALDASGRSYAVWYTEGADGRPSLRLAVAEPGAAFGAVRELHADPARVPDQPALAVAADGTGLVVWESFTAVRREVLAAALREGGRRLDPPRVISSGVKAFAPAVTWVGGDAFAVAWHEEAFPTTRSVVQVIRVQ